MVPSFYEPTAWKTPSSREGYRLWESMWLRFSDNKTVKGFQHDYFPLASPEAGDYLTCIRSAVLADRKCCILPLFWEIRTDFNFEGSTSKLENDFYSFLRTLVFEICRRGDNDGTKALLVAFLEGVRTIHVFDGGGPHYVSPAGAVSFDCVGCAKLIGAHNSIGGSDEFELWDVGRAFLFDAPRCCQMYIEAEPRLLQYFTPFWSAEDLSDKYFTSHELDLLNQKQSRDRMFVRVMLLSSISIRRHIFSTALLSVAKDDRWLAPIKALLRLGGLQVAYHCTIARANSEGKHDATHRILEGYLTKAKLIFAAGIQRHWLYRPGGPRYRIAKMVFENVLKRRTVDGSNAEPSVKRAFVRDEDE